MDQPTLRIGIYARISADRDGQQTATARQLDDCRAFITRKEWEVADEFEDVDISAYSLKATRPEFERLLLALSHGDIDGVVIWKLDRLTRQQRDLVRVMEACQANKAFLASVVEGIDTRETVGQFVAELLVAQARMESANTSIRSTRKAAELAAQGRPPGASRRCFGYERKYVAVVSEEAALIRAARDRIYAGETLNSVARDWEQRGIVTTEGNPWRPQHVKGLLTLATLSAQREHQGQLYPGTWPAILSPDDTVRLRALLNRHGTGQRSARKYLLTGFLRCGRCAQRISAQARDTENRRYVCRAAPGTPNCGKLSSLAEPLEAAVAEMLFVAVDEAALMGALTSRGTENTDVLDLVRADEGALEMLNNDYYVDRLLSREEFMTARATLTKRLEANRTKLSRRDSRNVLGGFVGKGGALREAWAAGTLDWRRSVVAALLDHVVLAPATRIGRQPFDPARVTPVWRF